MANKYFIPALLFLVFLFSPAESQIPRYISYQGFLTNQFGQPIPNGNHNITIKLYYGATDVNSFFSQTNNGTPVINGLFTIYLDFSKTEPNYPFDKVYYLGITVDNNPELTPRTAFSTVPYAFRADSANHLSSSGLNSILPSDALLIFPDTMQRSGLVYTGSEIILSNQENIARANLEELSSDGGGRGPCSCELNGEIYFIGGITKSGGSYSTVVEKYNPLTNSATVVTPLNVGRRFHSCVTFESKIYVFGGDASSVGLSYEVFNPVTEVWTKYTNMPEHRQSTSAVVYDKSIYLLGGGKQAVLDGKCYKFTPSSNTWAAIADMPISMGVTAVPLEDKIYCIGITSVSQTSMFLNVLDPKNNTWEIINEIPFLGGNGLCALLNNSIFFFNPNTNHPAHVNSAIYSHRLDSWKNFDMPNITSTGSYAVLNNKLYYSQSGIIFEYKPPVFGYVFRRN